MRLEHTIFNAPLSPEIVLTDSTDEGYPGKVWQVHEGEFPKVDVGMVSDGYGFEDSPDAEWISSGVNSKGPKAAAIARQANMMLWGFYGAPDRMNDSAKHVFLNAIVYMKQFDGHRPLVNKLARSRDSLQHLVDYIELLPEMEENRRKGFETYIREMFPADLFDAQGIDTATAQKFFDENREYFVNRDRGSFEVDADLVALQLSNRKPEFLDRLVAMLEKDPADPRARRLADRYVGGQAAKNAMTLRAWIHENRPYLFFSDVGGFRWRVDTNAKSAAARKAKL